MRVQVLDIRVKKNTFGSGYFVNPVRVKPGPDHPGSSGSDPGPGLFAIPNCPLHAYVVPQPFVHSAIETINN